jgi:peroxiredoxin
MKRRIKGIVHDESSTGKTVFVEPTEVVEANNRIRELEADERREIIVILTEFTKLVRPHVDDIVNAYRMLAEVDFIRARAEFAQLTGGIEPEVSAKPVVDWITAKHPLLWLALKKQEKPIVPLDIMLTRDRHILMIVLLAVVIALMWLLPDGSQPAAPATNAPKTEQTKNTNDAPDDIEATTLVKAGTQAPDFRVEMFDGTTFTLGSLRGKVVLLNFWATWCGPCREELSRVQKDIIDRFKGNEDFVFLPVSRGETRETVAAFREKMGYTFPMGLDPEQKIYRLYASNYIPRNFLIGKDGKVISATIGYEAPEFDELILLIERQLNSAN